MLVYTITDEIHFYKDKEPRTMRIDNPTADQIRKGDLVHFKPLLAINIDGGIVRCDAGEPVPLAHRHIATIDYITREDTLEVGDEFTIYNDSILRSVVWKGDGFVVYTAKAGPSMRLIIDVLGDHGFKIVRRANDPR